MFLIKIFDKVSFEKSQHMITKARKTTQHAKNEVPITTVADNTF